MTRLFHSRPTWAILSASFAALTAIFARIGVESIDPDLATFLRALVVDILPGILMGLTRKRQSQAGRSPRTPVFLGLSGKAMGASWFCHFRALQTGDAARVALIDKLTVVFVAIIAVLFPEERLSALKWLELTLMAAGAVLPAHRG